MTGLARGRKVGTFRPNLSDSIVLQFLAKRCDLHLYKKLVDSGCPEWTERENNGRKFRPSDRMDDLA